MTTVKLTFDDLAASAASKSFTAFHSYMWPDETMPAHQAEWAQILLSSTHDVIVAPPGTWKSTLCQRVVSYLLGKEPTHATLWLMNAAPQASRNVTSVAEIVTETRFRKVFPKFQPNPSRGWSNTTLYQTGIGQKASPSLYGAGLTGDYQGVRPDHLIIDDPTNPKEVKSKDVMNDQRRLMAGVIADRLNRYPNADECLANGIKVILTRWGTNDLVPAFKAMGFNIHEYPIIGDYSWGRLLFPERYPDSILKDVRLLKMAIQQFDDDALDSPDLWNLTFMCNPEAAKGIIFKREWWLYYEKAPKPNEQFLRVIAWDFSSGTGPDSTAWVIFALCVDGIYILGAGKEKLTTLKLIEKMKVMHAAYRPSMHVVENSPTSGEQVLQVKQNTLLPIYDYKPGNTPKPIRAATQTHLLEAGRVWTGEPSKYQWSRDLIDITSAFTGQKGGDDDIPDALVWGLKYMGENVLDRFGDAGAGSEGYIEIRGNNRADQRTIGKGYKVITG